MKRRREMQEDRKPDVLKRLSYIEGHIAGIRKMVEEDKYCVDILRQTYAVRKALEKLEAIIVEGHLGTLKELIILTNRQSIRDIDEPFLQGRPSLEVSF